MILLAFGGLKRCSVHVRVTESFVLVPEHIYYAPVYYTLTNGQIGEVGVRFWIFAFHDQMGNFELKASRSKNWSEPYSQ